MITRRDFIITTAATASSPLALRAAISQPLKIPLKALPKVRSLKLQSARDGRLLFLSDGPKIPPSLIRPEALEREFGPGTDLVLNQPDHWRMIEEGWFAQEDLYEPTDPYDPAFLVWHANYRPETEAHDLLYDHFSDRIDGPIGAYNSELGLELAEHPSTPRYATAKLDSEYCLPRFEAELAARTSWLVIDL